MDTRRGEANHRIAGCDILSRQQCTALGGADCKAREVIIAVLVEAGHLCGLAADQRTAGLPAAFGDAGNDRRGSFRIELAAGEIIQKEQRLGALDDEIIDRHRHQIDADAVVQASLDRDLDLGANAIGRRDQHGILEAGRLEVEQAAESADLGVGTGARGARTIGLIRSTRRLPASISTPESA